MRAPSFRCTEGEDGTLILHYYSDRDGLEHIVIGIVKVRMRQKNFPFFSSFVSETRELYWLVWRKLNTDEIIDDKVKMTDMIDWVVFYTKYIDANKQQQKMHVIRTPFLNLIRKFNKLFPYFLFFSRIIMKEVFVRFYLDISLKEDFLQDMKKSFWIRVFLWTSFIINKFHYISFIFAIFYIGGKIFYYRHLSVFPFETMNTFFLNFFSLFYFYFWKAWKSKLVFF